MVPTRLIAIMVLVPALAGCATLQRSAVNVVGNALSGGGSVYTSDNDPELVREALPFGLKTFESLLAVSPEHEGLLLASANGFAAYAYLLQQDADRLEATDLDAARALRDRASKLYLRGRDFAVRGLEVPHPNFAAVLRRDPEAALASTRREDVDFLYWAGASWAGALATDKDNPDLIADLPLAGALVARVLELDDTYGRGAAHEFLVSYEGGRPGGDLAKAREHYRRALELSRGMRASVHLALAEGVDVSSQNLAEFRTMLAASLAVDPDRIPEDRLVNVIAIRRAEWLQTMIPTLFVDADQGETQ
jgi:TRAP transporter T-component